MKDFTKTSGWQNFQNNFIKYAGKLAGNKFLLTIRDTFVLVAAPTMIAGFATMIQNVFLDPMNGLIFGKQGLQLGRLISGSWGAWAKSGLFGGLQTFANLVSLISRGSLSIFSLLIAVCFAYEVSQHYFPERTEHMTDVFYALGAYFICLPWNFKYMLGKKAIDVQNYVDTTYFGTTGVFAAVLISGVAVVIYNWVLRKNWTIKLPDSVPPAVGKSFESLLPGTITMAFFIAVTGICTSFAHQTFPALLLTILQKPALAISKTQFFAFFSQISWSFLFWFGIHPTSIWGGIFGMTWNINDTENMLGQAHHIFSTLFMNYSVTAAGILTVAPIVALMLFSKRPAVKKLVKIAFLPAVFNISEPIMFGLPIVLNPIYFIPFVFAQPMAFYIAYFFTKIGFIGPICNNVPWTMPTIISGILYTGNIQGAIVQIVCLAASIALYIPFVLIDNKVNKEVNEIDENMLEADK